MLFNPQSCFAFLARLRCNIKFDGSAAFFASCVCACNVGGSLAVVLYNLRWLAGLCRPTTFTGTTSVSHRTGSHVQLLWASEGEVIVDRTSALSLKLVQ